MLSGYPEMNRWCTCICTVNVKNDGASLAEVLIRSEACAKLAQKIVSVCAIGNTARAN